MSVDRLRPDPLGYVVGSVLTAVLATTLVGLAAYPAVQWAVNRGTLSTRLATAVVVGYGVVLTWQMLDDSNESTDDTGSEQSGLAVIGRGALVAFVLSGAVAVGVSLGSSAVTLLGVPADVSVFVALLYPWWEEATVSDALPVPLPLSFSGLTVYALTLILLVVLLVRRLVGSADDDGRGPNPNVGQSADRVTRARRWLTRIVDTDVLTGRSSSG